MNIDNLGIGQKEIVTKLLCTKCGHKLVCIGISADKKLLTLRCRHCKTQGTIGIEGRF